MKQLRIVSVVVASMLALSSYGEQQHVISFVGKAEETVKPDVAYVTLYAQAEGILMVDAVKRAGKLAEEITTAVMSESNIVMSVSVNDVALGEKETQYWTPDQKEEAPRPQVTRRIRVACKPVADSIYRVVDNAIGAGALMRTPSRTSYSGDINSVVIYGLEQSAEVVERVRKAAMADAKAGAEKLANLAGKTIGDVVNIGCVGSPSFQMNLRVMGMQIEFPTEYIGTNPDGISISQSIAVTFSLK